MRILIAGATGNIGEQIILNLHRQGRSPIAAVRNIANAKQQFGDIECRHFDFTEPATFPGALWGIDRLFFIAPHQDPVPSVQGLLRAAREAGVQQIVFSSGRTTGDVEGKPLREVEKTVQASDIPYTILRPGWFMQNFASWLGRWIPTEGKIYLPAGEAKTAFIDVRDIGAMAATIFAENTHNGRIYEQTGDEALDHHQVAGLIGRAIGKEVIYEPLEPEAFVRLMVEKGWSEAQARHTEELYQYVRLGKEAAISPDVEFVLKRKPIRFTQFVEDYRKAWLR
jgi:uncharacterized protein YbjT (DUF2867 family)